MSPRLSHLFQSRETPPIIHACSVLACIVLLAGCGGHPKPSEDDLNAALSPAFADQPYQVTEVDFTRRDITDETATIAVYQRRSMR